MSQSQDDDFTELVDPDITRVDVVGKAANGTTILMAKSADGAPSGLFDGEYVRDLIAKAEGEAPAAAETLTLTGSAGAMASLMKQAADRRAIKYVAKADLSTSDINDLPDSAFAYIEPGGSKDAQGKTTPRSKRHFPVHDVAHVRDALSRAPRSPFGEKAMPKIRAAAQHFGVQVAKADGTGEPGSPAWEAQDADGAQSLMDRLVGMRAEVQALAVREGTEVAAGHMDDLADVFELQSVLDNLTCAIRGLGGFAAVERAEAGADITKAQQAPTPPAALAAPSPQESTVTDTQAAPATAAAPASAPAETVAKSETAPALSEAEYAQLGREFLRKMAAEKATETTGATASGDTARVIPGTETVQAPPQVPDDSVTKAATQLATVFADAMAPVTKQLGELVTKVESQSERVEKALAKPDDRRSPLLNGATGEPALAQRGPTKSPEFQAIQKALDEMPEGPARDEARRIVGIAAITARFSPS